MGLPKTLKVETAQGDRDVKVVELRAHETPQGGTRYRPLNNGGDWDGHSKKTVPAFLKTWEMPEETSKIRARVESALQDGIPDQKRKVLRNQECGDLDERYVEEIARGEEVDRPFTRWSKRRRGEVRVAVAIDSTVIWWMKPELLQARMAMAAGIAGALESLDYQVSILATCLQVSTEVGGFRKARQAPDRATVFATTIKEEHEPFVESGFAPLADTGLRRLMVCWVEDSNVYTGALTDREWRELTGADLFVYITSAGQSRGKNEEGLPYGKTTGLEGSDVLNLGVDGWADIEPATQALEAFFQAMVGEGE